MLDHGTGAFRNREPDLFTGTPSERAALPIRAGAVDDHQRRGEGLVMHYGFHPSPFGEAILVMTEGGLAGLGFADDGDRAAALADMRQRWPRAQYHEDAGGGDADLARYLFNPAAWRPETPVRLTLIGTDFELQVWRMLLAIPLGQITTYSDLARQLGRPSAARAVGSAVGKNPISFVVPCHRVLGRSGALTGYHWGLARKRAMLAWEAAMEGSHDLRDASSFSAPA
ncbi:methylated-DNA--[protein]-cysteine S-methyltransferase [Chelatococcus sp. GCM10030263]|uniref:methylated-DNA--[protein]-cysteine S-methyltransferase n=1 Tax=Chelatococcus sp. GCM10030263 TaxID=3273387 RepID=UPI003610E34E